MLKLGSSWTFGLGPEMPPASLNDCPSGMEIFVGIGPPAPWVIEYMCHPPSIWAVACTVTLPPGATFCGFALAFHETGFCAPTAQYEKSKTTQENIRGVVRLKCCLIVIYYGR
jgi:hypothetical protein